MNFLTAIGSGVLGADLSAISDQVTLAYYALLGVGVITMVGVIIIALLGVGLLAKA